MCILSQLGKVDMSSLIQKNCQYYHHSIFCLVESKIGSDLKTNKENSDWNMFKHMLLKT